MNTLSICSRPVPSFPGYGTNIGRRNLHGRQWEFKHSLTEKDIKNRCFQFPGLQQQDGKVKKGEEEKRVIVIFDLDTKTTHKVELVLITHGDNGKFVIKNHWGKEFVDRRNLGEGDVIGMNCNDTTKFLEFSVLSRKITGERLPYTYGFKFPTVA